MRRLLICSPKGGSGKSQLSRSIAVAASAEGLRVVTVDLDSQQTLTRWYARRPEEMRSFQHISLTWDAVDQIVEGHAPDNEDTDLMVIDTPPSVEYHPAEIKRVIRVADLVLVPCRTSYDDIDSALPFAQAMRDTGADVVIVFNATKPRVNVGLEREMVLASGMDLAPAEVADRTDHARASARGLALTDIPNHAGAAEIRALWQFAKARMSRGGSAAAESPNSGRKASKRRARHVAAA